MSNMSDVIKATQVFLPHSEHAGLADLIVAVSICAERWMVEGGRVTALAAHMVTLWYHLVRVRKTL